MFRAHTARLLPFPLFLRHTGICLALAVGMVVIGVGIGVVGYADYDGFTWIDSLLNSSMIFTGMGPVGQLPHDGAKVFASLYALFSGLLFISVMALLLSPLMHRLLHIFHLADEDFEEKEDESE